MVNLDDNTNYGWKIGSATQKYIWGSDIVGWIDMSGVLLTNPPVPLPDPNLDNPTFICSSTGSYDAILTWNVEASTTYSMLRTVPPPTIVIPTGTGGQATDAGLLKNTTYSYTLTATNSGGSASSTASARTPNVDCPVPPSVKFTAVPPVVGPGGHCDLTWEDIQHINIPAGDTCVITGPGASFPYTLSTSTNGIKSTGPINATSRYTLTCDNGNPPNAVVFATCSLNPVYHER